MAPVPIQSLAGRRVEAWHVRDGQLLVRTGHHEEPVVCRCGRGHLLPTEEQAVRKLLVRCHCCGTCLELELA